MLYGMNLTRRSCISSERGCRFPAVRNHDLQPSSRPGDLSQGGRRSVRSVVVPPGLLFAQTVVPHELKARADRWPLHGRHRIFEDAIPGGEYQIRRNH